MPDSGTSYTSAISDKCLANQSKKIIRVETVQPPQAVQISI